MERAAWIFEPWERENVIKIGTDICSIKRISEAYKRFGNRFLDRILTSDEQNYVLAEPLHRDSRIAARFAAKEACAKTLGTGWRGISWKEVEVVRESTGEPGISLHGRAKVIADSRGLDIWQVSLSHEKEFATAFVLAHSTKL